MNERRSLTIAALITGACVPVFALIFALWSRAGLGAEAASDPVAVHAFASHHPLSYAALPVVGVVMHLAALVLVLGLHPYLDRRHPLLARAGTAMGLSWVLVDTLQNLVHYGLTMSPLPESSLPAAGAVADAIWHAGHFGGGIWVLTVAALGGELFGRALRALSVVCGVAFALHSFVVPVWPGYFGIEFLLVPLWAIGTAIAIRRGPAFAPGAPSGVAIAAA